MSDFQSIQKYACPACGADARWDAGRQLLVCPYCSTVSPARLGADGQWVGENDLVEALRQLTPDQRGWQASTKSVQCRNCHAISVFEARRVAQRCDFCGSPSIVAVEAQRAPIRPSGVLPFQVPVDAVREQMRVWYASRWFAPNRLRSRALTDTVHGVYLPYWTFDAQVMARWSAEAGHYYYETQTYRDANGNRQTRQVRRIRWVPSSGRLSHFFDDEPVPATKGVRTDLLRGIEPFPTKTELKPYDAGYLAGWVVEQYQIDLVAAARKAREAMDAKARGLCAAQVPGDTHRNLRVQADYSSQTFKHLLVPVWLLNYQFGRTTYQVLVNGSTGRIAGDRPYSWVKIVLTILAVGVLAVLAAALVQR
ncbi:MAG: zinc ribbon domain-containing protein [Verrucomicrobiae bacterium]|nr:zinc ribbon domain-containing protein [Verrucomicrobiae bacterium]